MKKIILIFVLALCGASFSIAQVNVSGYIRDANSKEAIPFANIILKNPKDSTLYKVTATDLEGGYVIENVAIGRYLIEISYVGYESIKETIRITPPSSGNVWIKNVELATSSVELKEVVVSAYHTRQMADRRVVTFTDVQRKKSRYAKDLLKILPELRENPLSGAIESLQGGTPLILINGVKSTETELLSIPPEKVKKVEYFDIPSARYMTVGQVINIITHPLENGYTLGLRSLTAPIVGFSDDMVLFSRTKNNHRLDLSCDLNYRKYKERKTDIIYKYMLDNKSIEDATQGQEKFGYTDYDITLKYAFSQSDKQTIQATFIPNIRRQFADGIHLGTYKNGLFSEERKRELNEHNRTFNPALDLYYWIKGKHNDEWTFNIYSALFQTKGQTYRNDVSLPSKTEIYSDRMTLKNQKRSIIAESAYSKTLTTNVLNFGYKVEYAHLNSNLNNLYGNSLYTSEYLQQYAHSEMVGAKNKFLYRISLGLTHLYNRSYSNTYHRIVFTPQLILGYNLNPFTSFRLGMSRTSITPDINMLSNNAQMITPDIISKGNPNLVSGSSTNLVLMGSHNNRYLNLSAGLVYTYQSKPIEQYFTKETDKLILTYRNSQSAHYIGGKLSLLVKPFGTEIFTINAYCSPTWQRIHTPEGLQKNLSVENFIVANFFYKGFEANYQYSIPTYSVSGTFRTLSENTNNLTLSYRYKRWKFTAGALFIGKDSHYRTETLRSSIVSHVNDRYIRDNKSMLVLGVEFFLTSGKNKSIDRKLNNSDKIAPTY